MVPCSLNLPLPRIRGQSSWPLPGRQGPSVDLGVPSLCLQNTLLCLLLALTMKLGPCVGLLPNMKASTTGQGTYLVYLHMCISSHICRRWAFSSDIFWPLVGRQ